MINEACTDGWPGVAIVRDNLGMHLPGTSSLRTLARSAAIAAVALVLIGSASTSFEPALPHHHHSAQRSQVHVADVHRSVPTARSASGSTRGTCAGQEVGRCLGPVSGHASAGVSRLVLKTHPGDAVYLGQPRRISH